MWFLLLLYQARIMLDHIQFCLGTVSNKTYKQTNKRIYSYDFVYSIKFRQSCDALLYINPRGFLFCFVLFCFVLIFFLFLIPNYSWYYLKPHVHHSFSRLEKNWKKSHFLGIFGNDLKKKMSICKIPHFVTLPSLFWSQMKGKS